MVLRTHAKARAHQGLEIVLHFRCRRLAWADTTTPVMSVVAETRLPTLVTRTCAPSQRQAVAARTLGQRWCSFLRRDDLHQWVHLFE